MKNKEKLAWVGIVVIIFVLGLPARTDAEWDMMDANRFRDLLDGLNKQTVAQQSIARSLEAIAKNCNK